MNLIESLKSYFNKKEKNKESDLTPEGICPNCWGHGEWDGEYYSFMKGENGNPSNETYNNFVQEVARKLDKITINSDSYACETCTAKYKEAME